MVMMLDICGQFLFESKKVNIKKNAEFEMVL